MDRPTFALVGSETLLGREIRDLVSTSAPPLDLRLIASEEEKPGTLTRLGDEPAMVGGLEAENLGEVQGIFLAGGSESSRRAIELAAAPIIDLTYAAEEEPEARVRAPMLEPEPYDADIHVIAHPAAIALALLLRRLHAHDPVREAVVQIFAPASEHGVQGVEELQQQTVSLLSFKPMPRAIFDTQLGFNLLARYGQEAPMALEESELRIERHLASLLALPGDGEDAPPPSLRLIQAPVFHGYSFSAWVEFEDAPEIEALENGLATASIEVRGPDFEPPTNVGQAGQGGVTVGGIAPDRNRSSAFWFWMVTDNLRLAAENALAVARQLT